MKFDCGVSMVGFYSDSCKLEDIYIVQNIQGYELHAVVHTKCGQILIMKILTHSCFNQIFGIT